jgi:hypothetical protein
MMRNMVAVLALGFAFAGCGVAPEEESVPVPATEAAAVDGGATIERAGTSRSAQPEYMRPPMPDPLPNPYCPIGEVLHCTLGPPPVCSCGPPVAK